MVQRVRSARLHQPVSEPAHLRCTLRGVQKVDHQDIEERKHRYCGGIDDRVMCFNTEKV